MVRARPYISTKYDVGTNVSRVIDNLFARARLVSYYGSPRSLSKVGPCWWEISPVPSMTRVNSPLV